MPHIVIDELRCKGCGLCVPACPHGLVSLAPMNSALGYAPALATDMQRCTGCCFCALVCPDLAITVHRE